jgi:hypothetical protein
MKLFISWSGTVSQQIAEELRKWIPLILPSVEPFITSTDIDKGARWQGEISKELSQSEFGIACLTSDNLKSQWLAFEAGALSKHLAEGRVATVLFGLKQSDVHLPLGMFQGTLFNNIDFRKLIDVIDATSEQHRGNQHLDRLFPMLYPQLEEPVKLILQNTGTIEPSAEPSSPNIEAIAQEILALLRQQNAVLSAPEKFLAPILTALESSTPPHSSPRDINPIASNLLNLAKEKNKLAKEKNVNALAQALTGEQPLSPSEPPNEN